MDKQELTGKYLDFINDPKNDDSKQEIIAYLKWAGEAIEKEMTGKKPKLPKIKHSLDFGYSSYHEGLLFFTRDCLVREENPPMYRKLLGEECAEWEESYVDKEVAAIVRGLFNEIFHIDGGIGNAGGEIIEMFYLRKPEETLRACLNLCARILVVFLYSGVLRQIEEEVALIEELGTKYLGMKRDNSRDGKGGTLGIASSEPWFDPYNGGPDAICRLLEGKEITDEWIWEEVIKNGYDQSPCYRYYFMERGEPTGLAGQYLADDGITVINPNKKRH